MMRSEVRAHAGRGLTSESSRVWPKRVSSRPHARFDASGRTPFATFAKWWVRQVITRAISDQARAIDLPPDELAALVRKVEALKGK